MAFTLVLLVLSIIAAALGNVGELTANGRKCLTDCAVTSGHKYWCKTEKTPSYKWDWDWCSPAAGVDYRHKACASSCDKDGTKYYWCVVQGGGWGYCSPVTKVKDTSNSIITSYGGTCKNECATHGYSYFWCKTVQKVNGHEWDYCSREKGKDYKDYDCASECKHNGKAYKWCYLRAGSWGYSTAIQVFKQSH